MNRQARRAAARVDRVVYPILEGVLDWHDVTGCICDGYPCPYCREITAPNAAGIWVCTCGWSGILVNR